MYDAFYGFREKPFSLLPDPDYLYLSPQHEKALGLLELSLRNQAGFCVVSGEIGAGKTTLIRKLLTLAGPEFRVGLVSNTLDGFGDLMGWILAAFRLPGGGAPVEQHERFIAFVIQQYGRGLRTVLIIDEAQNLGVDALEELRMLSNVNADKHQVLQVILVGQAGLRETLKRPELAQFAQRILLDFHLAPLGREDVLGYIRHRLLVAGADPRLFSEEAAAAVFRYSGGVPRIINLLCDTALVYGYAENRSVIEAESIHALARDRQSSSVAPALRLAALAPPVAEPAEGGRGPGVAPAIQTPEPTLVPASSQSPRPAAGAFPEPVTTASPAPADRPEGGVPSGEEEGDAEWLRRLADSALPTALRQTEAEAPPLLPVPDSEAEPEPEPETVPRPAPLHPPPAAASAGTGSGLGRVAALLVLLGMGAAGYGYFSAGDAGPGTVPGVPGKATAPRAPQAEETVAQSEPPAAEPEALPPPAPDPMAASRADAVPVPQAAALPAPAPPAAPPARASEAPPVRSEPAPVEVVMPARTTTPVATPAAPAVPPPAVTTAPREDRPEPAPAPAPPEPVSAAVAAPVPLEPAPAAVPEPPVAPVVSAVPVAPVATPAEALAAGPEAGDPESATAPEPAVFTTDPCRGPAARYLSTCR